MSELPDDVHTLSGAYALDAVEAPERAMFEEHLRRCPDCSEEVRSLRETLVVLAQGTAVAPPARLRTQVLARVADLPQVPQATRPPAGPPEAPSAAPPTGPRPQRTVVGRAGAGRRLAGAALVVLVAAGGVTAWQEHRAADLARGSAQRAQSDAATAQRIAAVLAAPQVRRVNGTPIGGGQVQVAVADTQAVVLASSLPELSARTLYQLWVVRAAGATSVGLGPGGRDAGGEWRRLVEGVRPGDVIAISVEPDGGSRQPTTVPFVTIAV